MIMPIFTLYFNRKRWFLNEIYNTLEKSRSVISNKIYAENSTELTVSKTDEKH